jgi:hypothetical protein
MNISIAYGPATGLIPEYRPYVPDRLIIQSQHGYQIIGRDVTNAVTILLDDMNQLFHKNWFRQCDISGFTLGIHWLCIEEDVIQLFELDNEAKWRSQRAQQLLLDINNCKNNPLRAISLIQASSAMIAIPFSELVKKLA